MPKCARPDCLMMSAAVQMLCSASQLALWLKLAERRKRVARGRAAISSHVAAWQHSAQTHLSCGKRLAQTNIRLTHDKHACQYEH